MNYLLIIENQQATIESLREQLDTREKQNVLLRDALIYCKTAGIRLANVDDAPAATNAVMEQP